MFDITLPTSKLQQLLGQAGIMPNDVLPPEQAQQLLVEPEFFEISKQQAFNKKNKI